MRVFGVNILAVFVVFALALSGLVYAREYERAVNVDNPLDEMLESEQWIDRHVLDSRRSELVIYSHWSDAMPARLRDLLERVSEIAGDRYRLIRVVDARTPELEELFYSAHLAVNQGLATGDYLSMQRELNALSDREQLDSIKAWVSNGSAVVLIKRGSHFMYESVGGDIAGDSYSTVRFEGP
ncbi:MAG: hypothetical protein GXX08_02800 [Firmicutes bacterium]|nr:hypothetical protein [Bacillota bacterium]